MTEFEKNMTTQELEAHQRAMIERDSGPLGAVNRGMDIELAGYIGNKTGKAIAQITGYKGDDYDR